MADALCSRSSPLTITASQGMPTIEQSLLPSREDFRPSRYGAVADLPLLRRAVLSESPFPRTFILASTNVVAKYTSLASLPFTLVGRRLQPGEYELPSLLQPSSSDASPLPPSDPSPRLANDAAQWCPPILPSSLIVSSPAQYRIARQSFAQHKSQARWFRTLFTLFSRYLWFVELEELNRCNITQVR